jgi:hypothetical protein
VGRFDLAMLAVPLQDTFPRRPPVSADVLSEASGIRRGVQLLHGVLDTVCTSFHWP